MTEPQDQRQQPQPKPDLAGYPDEQSLVSAYRASGAEGKRLREENEALRRMLEEQRPAANPRPDIPSQRTPWESLADYGVPVDPLRGAISEVVRDVFQPLAQSWQARTQMISRYPDYGQFESDVAQFIASDPQLHQSYQRMFAAEPGGAMEFALLKFREQRMKSHPQPSGGNGEDKGREADAGIPSSRAPQSRAGGDDAAYGEALQKAYEKFQKGGSPEEYARLRLHRVVSDEHLGIA